MRTLFLALIVFGFVFQSQQAKAQGSKKDLVGTWIYEAPDAPEGFTAGSFVFTEADGALSGALQLADGEELEFSSVEYADGKLAITFLVDYNTVTLNAEIKNKALTGSVSTPDGDLTVTATKEKSKKKKK